MIKNTKTNESISPKNTSLNINDNTSHNQYIELSSKDTNTIKTPDLSINNNIEIPNINTHNQLQKELTLGKLYSYRRPFSKQKRKLIFILICILNILINCDHGAIPAGTTELKKDNNLTNVHLGTIGSLVYLGLVFGSAIAGFIFSTYSSKWVVIISLFMSCFFLHIFTYIKSFYGLALCRVGCGFCQVFCYIYFPIWVDQYGVNNKQTIWLTFLQLGVPIGTMLGYLIEAFCIKYYDNWRLAFFVQIICLCVCTGIMFIIPDKFFSKNYKHSEKSQQEIEKEFQDLKNLLSYNYTNSNSNKYLLRNMNLINNIYDSKYGRPSLYSIFSMVDEIEEEGTKKYFTVIKELACNKRYIFTMLGISCMLFVVTGIQFWISDYMQEVMKIPSSKVYIIFSIVCISAPTLGVLLGGIFIQYLGGYTNKKSLDACFKISIIAAICGIFLPFIDIVILFVIFMWLLLFFGGSITPGLTGIMIASIPENSKEIGNSITQLFYNLIGYLPAPFIYGLVCKYTGGSESRWGLGVLVLWAVIGVLFLLFAKCSEFKEELHNISQDNIKEEFLENNNDGRVNSSGLLVSATQSMKDKSNIITSLFGRSSIANKI